MHFANFVAVLAIMLALQASAADIKPTDAEQNTAEVLAALKAQKPDPGNRILLSAPEIADSELVFRVKIVSTIPATDWIALFDPKAAAPASSQFFTTMTGDATLLADIKLQKTTRLRAVVRAGGKFYEVSKEVKIALTDCHD